MIHPTIVPYTDEWREGVIALANAVEWSPEMREWTWNPFCTLLAIHQQRVVGFIAGWAGQPVGFIDMLVVAPAMRGQGIGVFLWRAMIAHLVSVGVQRIRWLTANQNLQRMLERQGFATISQGVLMEVTYAGRV